MTEESDIKELQEQVKDLKEFPIKLTWKQIWIIATALVTLIGSSFATGIKVELEAGKLTLIKQEQEFQKQLSSKDDLLIEANRKYKEVSEDNIFLTNRYSMYKDRLTKCLDNCNFGIIEKDQ
jgi:hypothetical protein